MIEAPHALCEDASDDYDRAEQHLYRSMEVRKSSRWIVQVIVRRAVSQTFRLAVNQYCLAVLEGKALIKLLVPGCDYDCASAHGSGSGRDGDLTESANPSCRLTSPASMSLKCMVGSGSGSENGCAHGYDYASLLRLAERMWRPSCLQRVQ